MGNTQQWNGQLPDMMDMKTIDSYIQRTIQQALNGSNIPQKNNVDVIDSKSNKLNYELVELHQYYIVKIDIPDTVSVHDLSISLGNCKLIVTGLLGGEAQAIQLPEQPYGKQYSAQYKDGIIEVRLLKKGDDSSKDIYIHS